ncbi:MAG: KAP family NTPase, partial [Clostridia bacterium]|nr:KAP family NTPase [Clostridia bacterium]
KNYNNKIIIYSFNPLRYESQENLLEKFIDGLIKEIKYHAFVPEVEYIVSKYAKLLKSTKASFSFWGVSIGLPFGGESIDNVFDRLEATLSIVGKKIVIVVDDLDRLHFSSIKEVLFVIKKAFTLPNISYVLCYDTENITALEQAGLDTEKISEFLEKFINVKTSLYLDNELLLKYFSVSKDQSLAKNLLANTELVSKAVEGLKDIFTSKDFHNYLPFIGDARKLKRLVNTILLLEVEKTDFDNCDFNKQDLIHLLIIYISYPNIFRKIYNTETKGKKGFFSLVSQYEDGYPKDKLAQSSGYFYYENSEKYKKYLDTLSKPQKFIINKIFNASERQIDGNGTTINSSHNIPSEIYTSYACFNGSMWNIEGKNLEKYLNLITAMSRPHKVEQYKFYINAKNRLLSEKAIEEVFKEDDFSFLNGEATQEKLWRVLVNTNSGEFSVEKSKEIISYSLDILPKYSLIEIGKVEIGFRNTLPFFIVKLLDRVGWTDAEGKHSYHNTDENVVKIAHWIFGEDDHKEEGILDILAKEERGVMGLHDLLLFRLSCCTDRGGDIFNLSRALSKHGDPNAPTSGSVRAIVIEEMREMSQKVFGVFKTQYIDKKKNIFDEIDKLTLSEVCGENYGHVKAKIESGNIENIDVQLLILKSRLKSFMIYQLGNVMISSGIGCGYYNFTGKEDEKNKEGINLSINEYLFDYCFNPEINEGNYRHFLDYLLLNFAHSIGGYSDRFKYRPHINEFTKVLNNTTLACYWESHGAKIKSKRYESEDKKIFTGNYIASYKEDLESTFKVLDGLINSQQDN